MTMGIMMKEEGLPVVRWLLWYDMAMKMRDYDDDDDDIDDNDTVDDNDNGKTMMTMMGMTGVCGLGVGRVEA